MFHVGAAIFFTMVLGVGSWVLLGMWDLHRKQVRVSTAFAVLMISFGVCMVWIGVVGLVTALRYTP